MKLKQLQEKRGSLNKEIREIIDLATVTETRALSADEATKIEGLESELNQIDQTIHAEMRQMARESQAAPQLSQREEREVQSFDFAKVLNHLHRSAKGAATVIDGYEAEMIQEGEREARAAGVQAGGILLPRMIVRRENRDITATGGSNGDQGGLTIQTDKRGLLDDFFNSSIMSGLGSTRFEGLQGNLDLPRILAGTAPAGKAENGTADEVSPTFAMLSLTPKRLPAYIDISERLLMQSSSVVQSFLSNHLTTQMGAVREAAFFHGGGTNEAQGIAGTAGIGSVVGGTNGAAPTWTHLIKLEESVDTVNALLGSLHYATNGQIRRKLKETPRQASGVEGNFLMGTDGMINGYNTAFSNAISRTLTKGSSDGVASAIFFGNFADYIEAYWGGVSLEMVRDKTNAITGLYTLVASVYYDGGVVRPKSFGAMLDALGA
jgi:HK97 family phage major capsid protein